MKKTETSILLGTLLEKFFHHYLVGQKGASANTIASYSASLRLLLSFACERLGKKIDALTIQDLHAEIILDFLDHLEKTRGNSRQSRNQRLAAIRSFMRLAAIEDPTLVAQCARISQIPSKKSPQRPIDSLEEHEVTAFLEAPDQSTLLGSCDYAMLLLLYNTGARVQELVDARIAGVRWQAPHQITLLGKGNKERAVPLWPETIQALQVYLQKREEEGLDGDHLLLNARGEKLSRFGINHIVNKLHEQAAEKSPGLKGKKISPHTFRHTTALHLIRSGSAISVVKEWLGHADINTTHHYIEIDMKMKEQALKACAVPSTATKKLRKKPWRQPDLLQWLENLGRASKLCAANSPQTDASAA